ncbi:AMP-binding protein [Nocardia sp. CA-290969]|uniref:AMP-binding protein n=1 Tax=Nocardia sp. CA-290969 TaxID=3239986 RepID=UPI003D90C47D
METAHRPIRGSRRRRSGSPLFGQLLTAAVESAAEEVAVRYNPTGDPADQREMTYRELDGASSRLARELIDRGIGPGDVVAIGIARSPESVLAVWAVAKTGAAHVFIDPTDPAARIDHLVTDSGTALGLTTSKYRRALGRALYWIELDDPVQAQRIAGRSGRPLSYAERVRPLDEHHPAYIAYTGGAAGVVVTHGGPATVVAAVAEIYDVTSDSRVAHRCPPNHDLSILELLLTFAAGATLVIAPAGVAGSRDLAELMRREYVTHLITTAAALESVDPAGLAEPTLVAVVGDRVGPQLAGRWAQDHNVVLSYGHTEAAVVATHAGPVYPGEPITIGSGVPGIELFVLDARLRPVPAGEVGELYLAGPALAQGYLNRPGRTAERFVAGPFARPPGTRMYRTGDLVRRIETPRGVEVEYLGRTDFQVTVHGFRIEPAEIDTVLTRHEAIEYAVTLGKTLPSGSTAPVSYVLPRAGSVVDADELPGFLTESLPAHMVPAAFVIVDELPLTPVGELDHGALPEPDFGGSPSAVAFEHSSPAAGSVPAVAVEDSSSAEEFEGLSPAVASAPPVAFGKSPSAVGSTPVVAFEDSSTAMAVEPSASAAAYGESPSAAAFETSVLAGTAERSESGYGGAGEFGAVTEVGATHPGAPAPDRPLFEIEPAEYDRWRIVYPDLSEVLPLPSPGAELFFRSQLVAGGTGEQTRLVALELGGRPDLDRLHRAAQGLVDRHAALRTAYITTADGTPAQVVTAAAELPWQVIDDVGDYEMADLLAAEGQAEFAVDTVPLLRVTVYRTVSGRTHLVLVAHQLLFDSRSTPRLLHDLLTLYTLDGDPGVLPGPPAYGDHVRRLADADTEAARTRWSVYLDGARPTELAAVLAPPAEPGTGFGDVDLTLGADETAALAAYAAESGVTVDTVVRAVWAVLLASLTARTDIVFGAVAPGRPPGADEPAGLFDRVLPVRVRFEPGWTVRDLLTLMDSEQATLERHRLGPAGSHPAPTRLFDTVLAYEPVPSATAELRDAAAGLEVLGVTTWAGTYHPVTLLVESAGRMRLRLRYRRDTVTETSARALSALLHALTGQLLAVPARAAVPAPGWWHAPDTLARHGELPADRPRPAAASRRSGQIRRELPGDLHDALTTLAGQVNTNDLIVVQAALAVLLARLSGNRETAVGAFSARGAAAGLSVLHTEVDPAGGFTALLEIAREAAAAAHGRTGQGRERLGYLIDTLRTVAGQPPFRVLLATADDNGALPEKLDLRVDLVTTAAGATLTFTYARDLFDAPTVADHADRLIRILTAVAADATISVGDIDLLAPGERDLVLREWNSAGAAVPPVTLIDLIEARARLNPDAPAVHYGGTVSTFDDLLGRAYRVARAVIEAGAGPETVVAVALPRDGELPAALLGVLLSGAAYLPLDTAEPRQRLAAILAAAGPVAVLTTGPQRAAVTWGELPVVLVEDTAGYPADPVTDADRHAVLRPADLACVLYTSRSTDIPQGVGITHRNVVELFANTQLLFDFDDADVWTLCHSIAADLSVWELWCALAGGGSVVVVDEPTADSPERLRELLIRENVTVFNQTPSAFHRFAEADRVAHTAGAEAIPALRYVVLGGEALDPRALRDWYQRHPVPTGGDASAPWLVNMYGITEATVHASFLALDEQLADNPAGVIGRALPGLDAYVLDERLRPAPVGAPGEIYVAGAQLARGYIGSPGHTATRFVADPFGQPGSRMYRSGDTGRWAAFAGRANLEYAGGGGRGFRAEPAEPADDAGRPPFAAVEGRAETVVAEVFTALLGVDKVGADDDFFALGGDSLLGSRALARINRALGADLTLRTLVEAPTVAALAARVIPAAAPPAPRPPLERAEWPERIPLAPVQHRLRDRPEPARDNIALTVGLTGALDTSALRYAISDVLERHEPLRTRYPVGPDGRPYQDILPVAQALRGGVETAETDEIADAIAQLRAAAFDPATAAPIRGLLFTTGADEHVLALVTHGIATDGGSRAPLVRDLMRAYLARVSGESPRWSPVPVQYLDYAVWHSAVLGDAGDETSLAAQQLDYWRRRLRDSDGIVEFPLDRPRTEPVSVLGGVTGFTVDAAVHRTLEAVAGDRDATVFMVVHAAVAVLLQRLTGAGDIAIGTRISGRTEPGLDDLVGRFANTLVLRTRVRPTQTFTDLLGRARETDLAAFAHADIPFEQVMADVAPTRSLFDVLLSIRDTEQTVVQVPGLTVRAPVHDLAVAGYALQIDLDPGRETGGEPGELRIVLSYATDVLDQETVQSFGHRLTRLLTAVAADPRMRVGDIDLDGESHATPGPTAAPDGFADGPLLLDDTHPPAPSAGTATAQNSPAASAAAPVRSTFDRTLPTTVAADPADAGRAPTSAGELVGVPVGSADAVRAQSFSVAPEGGSMATADAVRAQSFSVAPEDDPVGAPNAGRTQSFSVAPEDVPVAAADAVRAKSFSVPLGAVPVATAGTALAQTLSASVEDDPAAPAVVRGEQVLTYQELDARSSRLARVLIARGCGPGSGVVNALHRGPDSVVATWAVLKAGAALVPADAVPVAAAAGLTVQVGLAVTAVAEQPGVEWIALDDPVAGAEIDAQSPRPVTHAHRTRPLRGADPVVVDATGRCVSYDRLAAAVHRVHTATGLTYESRTYRHGRGDDLAAVLEIVAAGAAGATVVLLPDNARSVTPAGEWITHLWSGSEGLAVLDREALADLVALITDEPAAESADRSGAGCTLDLPALLAGAATRTGVHR